MKPRSVLGLAALAPVLLLACKDATSPSPSPPTTAVAPEEPADGEPSAPTEVQREEQEEQEEQEEEEAPPPTSAAKPTVNFTVQTNSQAFAGQPPNTGGVLLWKLNIEGQMGKPAVEKMVEQHINELRSCYNAGLERDQGLSGQITVTWTVGGDRKLVRGSNQLLDNADAEPYPSAKVGGCFAEVVGRWYQPKPSDGQQVEITAVFVTNPP